MLASINRLIKKNEIERVKEEGKIFQRDLFGAIVLEKEMSEESQFGFIVSTKISKHSSQRNRIKRAFRESVRHHLYIIGKGYDILFLPKKEVNRKSTDDIMKEVKLFILKDLDRK